MDSPPELKALYEILLQRWKIPALCGLLGIVFGLIFCVVTPRQYQSEGRLLVMQKLAKFIGDKGKVLDPKAYDSLFATHLQLIGSPRIIQQAIDTHGLDELASLNAAIEDKNETVVDVIAERLRVSRAGSGDSDGAFVIRLEFTHSQAEDAEAVVTAIIETYQNYIQQSSLDGQQKAVSLISAMEADAEKEVDAKGQAYRKFLQAAPGVWNRNTLENPHQDRIDKLQTELTELEIRKVGIESRIQIMRDSQDPQRYTDLDRLALIDDMHVARLTLLVSVKSDELNEFFQSKYPERQEHASARYDDLLTLQREKSSLAENLGKAHPTMRQLDADIATLQRLLKENTGAIESPHNELRIHPQQLLQAYHCLLENDLADVMKHITSVNKSLYAEEMAAKNLLDVSIQGEQLQHEYERSRELYQAMLDLLREQSLVNDFGDYVAEILADPKTGEQVWPHVPILVAIFMMAGCLVGGLLAIVAEWLPPQSLPVTRIRHREQVTRQG
ncbi:MAG: Wzz/FepE/Etk N-terminal domain-containing protein [Planctomycetota bacterium]|nr:Wzz/FepE/Etk N-terminal domain-containing protein [Planctomycetota bacterium]